MEQTATSKGLARVLMEIIIRFMLIVLITTFILWGYIGVKGSRELNKQFGFLEEVITSENCLDADTGKYQDFVARLYGFNDSNDFIRFPIGNVKVAEKDKAAGDVIMWRVTGLGGGLGEHGFTVVPRGQKASPENYHCYNAPQKYVPIAITLTIDLYLPMPIYFGKQFSEDTFIAAQNNMLPTWIPGTNGVNGTTDKGTPALRIRLTRERTVVGTKFYKGKTIGG